ncbi:Carbon monoxide dehydrogenase subunit G [Lentzea fradiae]|uniref:Carbon monoxide dehydrogenase subunit G n=1 Tax=Lentzea fradiae TaxID=200378 RepID=A0A1G7UNL1_9PSEU|nr:SRPBCC family protein [Lentzea fradiae]SDG49185.1 Carbon monoxide dehydrogenase subunit G [Lentzea fradiae]
MLHYDISAFSPAPREAVWALLVDSESWPRWSSLGELDRRHSANLDPAGRDGVGAVRAFRKGKNVSQERITELREPALFAYEAEFLPIIRDYRARVELEPADGGTLIRWRGRYTTSWWSRWFTQRFLRRLVQGLADDLAAHAARHLAT